MSGELIFAYSKIEQPNRLGFDSGMISSAAKSVFFHHLRDDVVLEEKLGSQVDMSGHIFNYQWRNLEGRGGRDELDVKRLARAENWHLSIGSSLCSDAGGV